MEEQDFVEYLIPTRHADQLAYRLRVLIDSVLQRGQTLDPDGTMSVTVPKIGYIPEPPKPVERKSILEKWSELHPCYEANNQRMNREWKGERSSFFETKEQEDRYRALLKEQEDKEATND